MTLKWKPPTAAAGLHGKSKQAAPMDPYYRWAKASRWQGLARAQGNPVSPPQDPPERVRILAQAKDPKTIADIARWPGVVVPAPYGQTVPGGTGAARHFTAEVPLAALPGLQAAGVLRWELAVPVRQADPSTLAGHHIGRYGRDRQTLAFQSKPPFDIPPASKAPCESLTAVVGVIDFGCAFLHEQFRGIQDPKVSTIRLPRIKALWDQGRCAGVNPWGTPAGFSRGRELGPADLKSLAEILDRQGSHTDEAELYRYIDYLIAYDDARRRTWYSTHGTHVLDMFGGWPDPLAAWDRLPSGAPARASNPAEAEGRDPAARADIVFVQLPALTAGDVSGASLGADVLDGVRYILDRSAPDAPVVVNISYGTFAGPHDGSSLIESALDELLTLRPRNFAVVVPAGNSRQLQCHARRTVRKDRPVRLRLRLMPGDATDTFVELWYRLPRGAKPLQVRLRTPGALWSDWVGCGQTQELARDDAPLPAAMVMHDAPAPGQLKHLAVIALAPTTPAENSAGELTPDGVWEIEVAHGAADADCPDITLDAWIERDDAGPDAEAGQARFEGPDRDDQLHTLGSLSTGQHTLVAGGFRLDDGQPADYASLGPRDSPLPLVMAACEESADDPSIRAAAVRSAEAFRMNGTSVAAPALARRVLNHLVDSPAPIDRKGWTKALRSLLKQHPGVLKPMPRAGGGDR